MCRASHTILSASRTIRLSDIICAALFAGAVVLAGLAACALTTALPV
jgi:hypothetical protein